MHVAQYTLSGVKAYLLRKVLLAQAIVRCHPAIPAEATCLGTADDELQPICNVTSELLNATVVPFDDSESLFLRKSGSCIKCLQMYSFYCERPILCHVHHVDA